jgi:hypothetical protein
MTVIIAWKFGEFECSVEAPTPKEALKAYRGVMSEVTMVAEERVRQLAVDVCEQYLDESDKDAPWNPPVAPMVDCPPMPPIGEM